MFDCICPLKSGPFSGLRFCLFSFGLSQSINISIGPLGANNVNRSRLVSNDETKSWRCEHPVPYFAELPARAIRIDEPSTVYS